RGGQRYVATLGRLDLLHVLFGEVLIPPAVNLELVQPGKQFAAVDLSGLSYIRIQAPTDMSRVQALRRDLDAGPRLFLNSGGAMGFQNHFSRVESCIEHNDTDRVFVAVIRQPVTLALLALSM